MKFLDVPQSGSWANETRSRNQFGQYLRARTAPVQPSSAQAIAARGALSISDARWSALTDLQRESWLGTERVRKDRLGREIVLSGRALFVSMNTASWYHFGAFINDPPPLPVFDLAEVTFTRTQVLGVIHLTVNWTPTPANGLLVLSGTGPVNTGVTAFTTWGRSLGWLDVDLTSVTPPLAVATADAAWVARFGPQPGLGGVSFFAWRQLVHGCFSPLVTSRVVTV